MNTKIIIDFDSTLVKVEGLDMLAQIALSNSTQKDEITKQIEALTNLGMAGDISFSDSLQKRIALLQANRAHVQSLAKELEQNISTSFLRNKQFIANNTENIYIVSGGFNDYVVPVATSLGVKAEHIYANDFLYNNNDDVIGFDSNNLLSQDGGKVKLLQQLNLQGDVCIIGDGYTDYQLKADGLANTFYLFVENAKRDNLLDKADHVINSLDEFLYINNMKRSQSYPKTKMKALLLEGIHPNAVAAFGKEGYQIEEIAGALNEEELCKKITGVQLLCIRSKTQVSNKVLQCADKLHSIGAFCIGTNQIDNIAAVQKGIAVFNAPYSNTRSVVELAIGEMIMLIRNAVGKSNELHHGVWNKSAANSFEIRGKTLGIVGYGNIGKQLSVLAENLGMKVIFYDIADILSLGNAHRCETLHSLLEQAHVVSLHVDGRASNKNLIDEKELQAMRQGAILLNLSRGHIVNLDALKKYLDNGKLGGAAVDVYPYEPVSNDEKFTTSLQGCSNTILTPHIGGSTLEAQANIGEYVPQKMINYINKGDTQGAVNFPEVQLPNFAHSHRLLHIHKNIPGILAQLNAAFAQYQVNIVAQYLKTNEHVGYVITDVDIHYNEEIIAAIKNIEGTLKFRMLY